MKGAEITHTGHLIALQHLVKDYLKKHNREAKIDTRNFHGNIILQGVSCTFFYCPINMQIGMNDASWDDCHLWELLFYFSSHGNLLLVSLQMQPGLKAELSPWQYSAVTLCHPTFPLPAGGPAVWPTRPGKDNAGTRHRTARGVQCGGDECQVSASVAL